MTEIKRRIETKEEAEIFALFLACERNRHKHDIERAEADLWKLAEKWGIAIPWNAKYFTVVE